MISFLLYRSKNLKACRGRSTNHKCARGAVDVSRQQNKPHNQRGLAPTDEDALKDHTVDDRRENDSKISARLKSMKR